ncbi:MAG: DUF853 family protein [Paludibacter sp.]|nr:DUF853 family protein [Paludibacter sp.]
MNWIVTGPDKDNKVKLISRRGTDGVLPKGSYLTIIDETNGNKPLFILRVEDSSIEYPYSPSHTIVDMDLQGIKADLKWQNHISARIIKDLNERNDGLVNPVSVLSVARRSNQEEVNNAMGYEVCPSEIQGPKVFLATIHDNKNQILVDENQNFLFTHIRPDFIYHQTLVVGKTGSGKTVATKYLAQYFVEEEKGAVLAINVKDVDFLRMDRPSNELTEQIEKEWDSLGESAHKMENFRIYYPATTQIKPTKGVNPNLAKPISLDVKTIEPEALAGLLRNITDIAGQYLPDIFRYWRNDQQDRGNSQNTSFNDFVNWFTHIHQRDDDRNTFPIKNTRGDIGDAPLAHGTAANILRNLNLARVYFDDPKALLLNAEDILSKGMMSVIDLEDANAKTFGSILLRHLLHQIVELKSSERSTVPILIIIDEVHQFYNPESKEALDDLDTICRQGRSQEIGVVFSSQTPTDIPKGLSSVINTKLFFKSDASAVKMHGVSVSDSEMQNLKKGFAIVNIHEMPQLKMVKFPLAFAGVIKKGS